MFAHGGRADFRGEDGEVYNLLSARNLSFNARFEFADFVLPHKLVRGSFIASVGITARIDSGRLLAIEFNSTKGAHDTHFALVRQPSLPDRRVLAGAHVRLENLLVQLREYSKALSLIVNDGHRWKLSAIAKNFPNPDQNPGRMLLHVGVEALYDADKDPIAPHGLIGQSYDGDDVAVDGAQDDYRAAGDVMTTKAQAEGAIEGSPEDYKMGKQPFATAFKFSRFDSKAAPHRDITALHGLKHQRNKHDRVVGSSTFAADEDVDVDAARLVEHAINSIHHVSS